MVEATDTCIENARWRLELDPDGGHIASLTDKEAGVEVFCGPAAVPLVVKDEFDTWGHDAEEFRDVFGRFGNARVTLK